MEIQLGSTLYLAGLMTPLDVDVLGPGLMVLQRYHAPILEIPEVKALVLAIFFGLLFTNIVSLRCCPFLLLAAFCLSLKGKVDSKLNEQLWVMILS